jgi:hypothetical protein
MHWSYSKIPILTTHRFSTSLGRDREGSHWHHVEGAFVEDIGDTLDLDNRQNSYVTCPIVALYIHCIYKHTKTFLGYTSDSLCHRTKQKHTSNASLSIQFIPSFNLA